jgi:FtsH-binding integral membrane protein
MKSDFARNVRLVTATTLLSLWGYSHLEQTSLLGDLIAPLVLALLIAPGANWFERGTRGGHRTWAIALLALVVFTALLSWMGSEESLGEFSHSPWFVLPVWLLALVGLVRNATHAERSAASAQAGTVVAHAPDAG